MAMMSDAVTQVLEKPAAAPLAAAPHQASSFSPALEEAMGITQAARKAAANDPNVIAAQDAAAANMTNRQESLAEADALEAQMADLINRPEDAMPAIPKLPDMSGPPAALPDNPLRMIGQYLPILGALSSSNVQGNTVAALNAAAGAMNAVQISDQTELEKQHKLWKDNLDQAIQKHQMEMGQYRAVLEQRSLSANERLAKLQGLASLHGNKLVRAAVDVGGLDQIGKYVDMMDKAAEPVMQVWQFGKQQEMQQAQLDQARELAIMQEQGADRRSNAQIAASQAKNPISLADIKAQLVMAAGMNPDGKLTTGQQQMWDKIIELEKNGATGGLDLAAILAAGGGAQAAPAPTVPANKGPGIVSRAAGAVGRAFARGAEAEVTAGKPPAGAPANARLARDGKWYAPDPKRPGKFLLVTPDGG